MSSQAASVSGGSAPGGAEADARRVSHLFVQRGDEVLLDERIGLADAAPDLFFAFSVSKPFIALAVHLLAARGEFGVGSGAGLGLDAPIARFWPEFAAHGKGDTTIRHALTHRTGMPYARGSALADFLIATSWQRSTTAAAAGRPRWAAGSTVAYGLLDFGFILGELVRRVSGVAPAEFVRRELLLPLGMGDTFLGLPGSATQRSVALVGVGGPAEALRAAAFNRPAVRQAVIPAASVHTNVQDLVKLYRMLLREGALPDGRQLLPASAVAAALELSSDGERDRVIGHSLRWGTGFQLGGLPGLVRPMGTRSHPRTFGHNGSGTCNVWADPSRELVFVNLTNQVRGRAAGLRFQSDASDRALALADA